LNPKNNNIIFLGLPSNRSYSHALTQPQYLGVRYLAAVLRKNGYNPQIVNIFLSHEDLKETLFATDLKRTEEQISHIIVSRTLCTLRKLDNHPYIFGITTSAKHIKVVIDVIKAIKKSYPDSIILLGGVFATLCAEEVLLNNSEVDYILAGEAELSIIPFLNALSNKAELKDVNGLVYRSPDGKVIKNPHPNIESDIDSLPFPVQDDIVSIYNRNVNKIRISSTRGCYGKCSFCSLSAFDELQCYSSPRSRSAISIVDEIEYLNKAYGIKQFVFVDPNFMVSGRRGKERAVDFANELLSRGLYISFKIDVRANDVDTDIMSHLKKAGLYGVEIGIESFDNNILNILNKKITAQQNIEAIRTICKLGLSVTVSYIFYTPWTTVEYMERTLPLIKEFVQNPRVEWFPIFKTLKPFHGTKLLQQISSDCEIRGNYLKYSYKIKDSYAEDIKCKHMAFNNKIEALIFNAPNIKYDNVNNRIIKFLRQRYFKLMELLKQLSILYLEKLLKNELENEIQYINAFDLYRNSMMAIYDQYCTDLNQDAIRL
jgi:hypothetical protein